jgi:Ca2+-binding RTX toxin-like protein
LEALESRTLFAVSAIDNTIAELDPGIHKIGHSLYLQGTPGNDNIRLSTGVATPGGRSRVLVELNGLRQLWVPGGWRRVIFNGAAGNDVITINPALPKSFHPRVFILRGGDGNDSISGGARGESLFGDAGTDTLVGNAGRDQLYGGDGNDQLTGGAGNDRMFGGLGDDQFLNNETAAERATGGRDILDGGGGRDTAQADAEDVQRLITF